MRRLLLVMLVACAAQHRAEMPPAAPPMANDPHSQIEQLSAHVAEQRDKLGLSATLPRAMAMTEPDTTCHPSASDTCHDVCTVTDDICGNAKKICDLANQLPGDSWAEGKCKDATDTCSAAHAKCCSCA